MTLAEFATAIGDTCGMTDADSVLKIKRAVSRRYRMIWDAHLWRDALALVTMTANAGELTLPLGIELVVAVRWDAQMIYPTDQQTLFQYDPTIFERSGVPLVFSQLTPVGALRPPTPEPILIVSDAAADTGAVQLRGELAGVERVETLALNGTTPLSSTQSFDILFTVAKAATAGTVTVAGATSAAVLQTLWPEESERKIPRLRLHEAPQVLTKRLLICGKRRFRPLTNDLDTPLLRRLDNAILAYGRADEWKRQRQYSKSQAEATEADAMVRIAIDGENTQGAAIMRIIPDAGDSESFDLSVNGFSGKGYW